jgi:hypothetical protein
VAATSESPTVETAGKEENIGKLPVNQSGSSAVTRSIPSASTSAQSPDESEAAAASSGIRVPSILISPKGRPAISDDKQKDDAASSAQESRATPSDPRQQIGQHLALLSDHAATKEARRASEDALLTALGGGYEPDLRLKIVRGLVGKLDVAYEPLLAKHLEGIRDEAREIGNDRLAKEAVRLLESLEASRESAK